MSARLGFVGEARSFVLELDGLIYNTSDPSYMYN